MNLKPARVLGIETSCDETAASVVENGDYVFIPSVREDLAGGESSFRGYVLGHQAARDTAKVKRPTAATPSACRPSSAAPPP